jgi:biotin carboxylase
LVDVQVCFPPRISQKVEKEASILAQRIVMALKVENAPIHLEFILSPSRGLVPVECAVRGAGFNLFNFMVPWCTGVDVMGAQLNLILGNPLRDIAPKRKYAAILEFPQPKTGGKIQKISYRNPSEDSLLFKSYVEIQMNKVIGETVVPATNGSERIGHIFIFSETWSEVESIYSKIDFSIEVE